MKWGLSTPLSECFPFWFARDGPGPRGRYDAPLSDALRAIDRTKLTVVPVVSPELARGGPEDGAFVPTQGGAERSRGRAGHGVLALTFLITHSGGAR